VKTAAIIIVGNEILSGKVEDLNARFLIAELRALGVALRHVAVIPDDVEAIAAAVRGLCARVDYLFTSGGVGPTHDDLTIEGVARGLGRRVVRAPTLEALLRAHFGPDALDSALRMADVPEGAEMIGEELRWPVCLVQNVYVLPGVPEIFRRKFLAIKERFRDTPFVLRSIWVRAEESRLAQGISQVAAQIPEVEIGSYPRSDPDGPVVRITVESKAADAVARAVARLVEGLPEASLLRTE